MNLLFYKKDGEIISCVHIDHGGNEEDGYRSEFRIDSKVINNIYLPLKEKKKPYLAHHRYANDMHFMAQQGYTFLVEETLGCLQ